MGFDVVDHVSRIRYKFWWFNKIIKLKILNKQNSLYRYTKHKPICNILPELPVLP